MAQATAKQNAVLTPKERRFTASMMLLEAIFSPDYLANMGKTLGALTKVRGKRAAAEIAEPLTAKQVREVIGILANSYSLILARRAKLEARLFEVLTQAQRLKSLREQIPGARQAEEAAQAVRDALPEGAPRGEPYNVYVRARNAHDSLKRSAESAKVLLGWHIDELNAHWEKLKKEGRV